MQELEAHRLNAPLSVERYKALLTLVLEDEDEADRMAADYMLQQINAGVYKE